MFLWHPMHENDLKSRACSTYSSLSNYQEKWNDDDTKKKVWWFTYAVIGKYTRGSKNSSGYFCKTPESWMFLLWVLNWFGSILLTDVSTQAECADIPRPIHFKTVWYSANTAQCIPCRRGIASKSEDNFRNDSLAFYRLHPGIPGCTGGSARQYGGGQPENLENKH